MTEHEFDQGIGAAERLLGVLLGVHGLHQGHAQTGGIERDHAGQGELLQAVGGG